ncbi:MAG TPA: hypothetical protein VH796_00695 [Nitrososphaeraceae archaeon]|jgi:hypothetical protein
MTRYDSPTSLVISTSTSNGAHCLDPHAIKDINFVKVSSYKIVQELRPTGAIEFIHAYCLGTSLEFKKIDM